MLRKRISEFNFYTKNRQTFTKDSLSAKCPDIFWRWRLASRECREEWDTLPILTQITTAGMRSKSIQNFGPDKLWAWPRISNKTIARFCSLSTEDSTLVQVSLLEKCCLIDWVIAQIYNILFLWWGLMKVGWLTIWHVIKFILHRKREFDWGYFRSQWMVFRTNFGATKWR